MSIRIDTSTLIMRLASGRAINRATDNPAGLAQAERYTSQVNEFAQLSRNAQGSIAANTTRQSTINSHQTSMINTAAARSRILDTDYARSMSELISARVRQQAEVAVQAHARIDVELTYRLLFS